MQGMTISQARKWCKQWRAITVEDIVFFESAEKYAISLDIPSEHRRIVALCSHILSLPYKSQFEGGFLWLQRWDIGVTGHVSTGWRILEDIRRAHGEVRSLEIAPAQFFRHDEFVELHVFLIQVMAYGWAAYFVPSSGNYIFELRESGKLRCMAESAEDLEVLYSALKDEWQATKEDPNLDE